MRRGKVFRTETRVRAYTRASAIGTKARICTKTDQSAQNTLGLTQDGTVRTGTTLATIGRNTILRLRLSPLKSSLFTTITNNRAITLLTTQNGRTKRTDTTRPRSNRLNKPSLRLVASESLAIRRRALIQLQRNLRRQIGLIPTTL